MALICAAGPRDRRMEDVLSPNKVGSHGRTSNRCSDRRVERCETKLAMAGKTPDQICMQAVASTLRDVVLAEIPALSASGNGA